MPWMPITSATAGNRKATDCRWGGSECQGVYPVTRSTGQGGHPDSGTARVVGNDGLYTTPRDLLLWEQNFEDVRVGTPEILAAMQKHAVLTSGKPTEYGFGLFIRKYRGL